MLDFDQLNFDFNLTFDQWVKFVFDHPVSNAKMDTNMTTEPERTYIAQYFAIEQEVRALWYSNSTWDEFWERWAENISPEKQLLYATTLFENASELLVGKYSLEQIDQGLNMLLSGPTEFAIDKLIWNRTLSRPMRVNCITAMVSLFKGLFARFPTGHSCFMWWDVLREWEHSTQNDLAIKEVMLQALTTILDIPTHDCQMSALHGLGHLRHPDKRRVIENYLKRHPDLDAEMREYALDAIENRIL